MVCDVVSIGVVWYGVASYRYRRTLAMESGREWAMESDCILIHLIRKGHSATFDRIKKPTISSEIKRCLMRAYLVVGSSVGERVGVDVGACVGASVGELVGAGEGDGVGELVGLSVGSAW